MYKISQLVFSILAIVLSISYVFTQSEIVKGILLLTGTAIMLTFAIKDLGRTKKWIPFFSFALAAIFLFLSVVAIFPKI